MHRYKGGFTLIELMIVVTVIGILVATLFYMGGPYLSRSRDVTRFADLQQYARVVDLYYKDNDTIPGNVDSSNVLYSSYCADEVFFEWKNGSNKDNQFAYLSTLMGGKPLRDPMPTQGSIFPCTRTGSYLYSSITTYDGKLHSLLGARMSILANGNYKTGSDIGSDGQVSSTNLLKMQNTYKGTVTDTTQGDVYYFVTTQH